MTVPKEMIFDLIDDLPDERLGTVESFLRFVRQMEEMTPCKAYSEEKTIRILQEEERYLRSRARAH